MKALVLIASGLGLLPREFGAQPTTPTATSVDLAVVATPSSSDVSGDTRDSALNDGSHPR